MSEIVREFDVIPAISHISEAIFKRTYGEHIYKAIFNELIKTRSCCSGCGYPHHLIVENLSDCLYAHILEINYENPAASPAALLCKECHLTQHFESLANRKWVKLVNSTLSQSSLLVDMRGGRLIKQYEQRRIVDLKKTPEDLIKELQAGIYNKNDKVKVIFTSTYYTEVYPNNA